MEIDIYAAKMAGKTWGAHKNTTEDLLFSQNFSHWQIKQTS
jgi:hypothetical protein